MGKILFWFCLGAAASFVANGIYVMGDQLRGRPLAHWIRVLASWPSVVKRKRLP